MIASELAEERRLLLAAEGRTRGGPSAYIKESRTPDNAGTWVREKRMSVKGPALNLLVHPSPLAQPSWVTKVARSLRTQERSERTKILGVDSTQLPARESLAPRIELKRIRGASVRERFDALCLFLSWQIRVYWYYRRKNVKAVVAQNLFPLSAVHALAHRAGAVFAYNARELETEAIASKGLRQKIQGLIEEHWICKADLVLVVNEPIKA